MDQRKHEAVRALDSLERYYQQLDPVEHAQLKEALHRLISVFKSRLFQALVDIQTLYESFLSDQNTNWDRKIKATNDLTEKLETRSLLRKNKTIDDTDNDEYAKIEPIVSENPLVHQLETSERISPSNSPDNNQTEKISRPTTATDTLATNNTIKQMVTRAIKPARSPYEDHWTELDVELDRPNETSLGFSVAGGIDTPSFAQSSAILVSKITKGGLAERSGKLKLYDIILKVNDTDFTRINHKQAVDSLRSSGNHVNLTIRRLEPRYLEQITVIKPPETKLGFSIAGGISHCLYADDFGIFIDRVIPGGLFEKTGRLKAGDRLMSIQSERNTYDLEFKEHREAVQLIRQSCTEGSQITLTVAHITHEDEQEEEEESTRPPVPPARMSPNQESKITAQNDSHETSDQSKPADEIPSGQRLVTIERGSKGFGFNIITHDERTFISGIIAGGSAEKTGQLHRGDEVLSINDIPCTGLDSKQAAETFRSCGNTIHLVVVHNNDDYIAAKDSLISKPVPSITKPISSTSKETRVKSLSKHQFYVKTKFDYDPKKDIAASDNALAFRMGDILYITNAADDNWWQARRVTDDLNETSEYGIIPSSSRFEKKERARRKRVNFDQEEKNKKSGSSKNKRNKSNSSFQSNEESETDTIESISPYEVLNMFQENYFAPVIILGPLSEIVAQSIVSQYQDRFSSCVPHTTRPKRQGEVDGVNYYFVTSREEMMRDVSNDLFIEYGESNGNLYGTHIDSVRKQMEQSKHVVLNIKPESILRLRLHDIVPFVIFIKVPDVDWIFKNMPRGNTEEEAQRLLENAEELEGRFQKLFMAMATGKDLGEVTERIVALVDNYRKTNGRKTSSRENLQQ